MCCSRVVLLCAVLLVAAGPAAIAQTPSAKSTAPEPTVYTLGAPLSLPQSIDVDRYGRMYVLDAGRQVVMRFSLDGKLEASWPTEEHGSESWQGRQKCMVSRNGTIFLGQSLFNRNIMRIDALGKRIFPSSEDYREQVIVGRDDGSFLTSYPIFSYDGNKVTGVDSVKYIDHDSDGKVIFSKTIKYGEPSAYYGVGNVGPDGMFYSRKQSTCAVEVRDVSGNLKRRIQLERDPKSPDLPGGGLNIDTNGDIYIVSTEVMHRYSRSGKLLNVVHRTEHSGRDLPGSGTCKLVNGLVFMIRNSETYASSSEITGNSYRSFNATVNEIRVIAPDGQCVARYVPFKPELNMPASIAVGDDGSYMVVENASDTPWLYMTTGRTQVTRNIGGYPHPINVAAKPGGGFYMATEEIDPDGKYVKDVYTRDPTLSNNHVVRPYQIAADPVSKNLWTLGGWGVLECFSPESQAVKRFGEREDLNFKSYSTGMAVSRDGYIYLPDTWKHTILKLDFDGKIVARWGKQGSGLGEMRYPEGLALDSQNRLYVADCENNRIQVFDASGKPLGVWSNPNSGGLNRPCGVAVGPNQTLWVTDTFNDRIVKIPLADFWKQATTQVRPAIVAPALAAEPIPAPGEVTVTGIVIAGSDDLSDIIYIESPDRAWGMTVNLPQGKRALRGEKLRLKGRFELKAKYAKHITARSVEKLTAPGEAPDPLGMSNLYVGDGCRSTDAKVDLSNLGLLVRTWGRVTTVDRRNGFFVINDGSYPKDGGLIVYASRLVKPLTDWPVRGQYLAVTGVSATWQRAGGTTSGIRIRSQADIQLLR